MGCDCCMYCGDGWVYCGKMGGWSVATWKAWPAWRPCGMRTWVVNVRKAQGV